MLLAKKGLEGQRNAEKACLTWGKRGIMTTDFRKSNERMKKTMSRNIHTGINPHRRPRNASNAKERVAHVAATISFLNQAAKDETSNLFLNKTIKTLALARVFFLRLLF
ncbi:hypothetical protein SB57_08810, partial [Lactobacillus delbrueckii subsp. bulgaricus]